MLLHTCSSCGFRFSEGDKAWDTALRSQCCPECLNPFVQSFPPSTAVEESSVRPWVRYWARMIDIYAFCAVAVVFLGISAPRFVETTNEYILGMILMSAWILVEALMLSSFQTTPGKWVFNTQVALASGEPISFPQA